MNAILILVDSCNRHYLSPYGCRTVRTPNIQQLADRGVTFTNHMIGSAPCMPARREMMTGRREFLFRGWGHLEPFDAPIAAMARESGVVTQMITDHYHYWEHGAHGYLEHFEGCDMIRGHELDYWKTEPLSDEPDWVRAINQHRPGWGSRYYRNVARFRNEADWHSPTVFRHAAEWLDANAGQGGPGVPRSFFLQIESFDAHEPFYVPEPYRSMYTSDLDPSYTCWPPYQREDQRKAFFARTSMAELAYIRAQYQGKLTMVDNAIGQVWAAMDRHDLWRDTMVIITSDHGHELAEAVRSLDEIDENARDRTLRVPFGKQHPHYLSHANIPLIVWHPDLSHGGRRIDALTCTVDMYATVLDALGADHSRGPHSLSILPLLAGEDKLRDLAYWGTFGEGICCTDGDHVLSQGANTQAPLYWYSAHMDGSCSSESEVGRFISGVECPVWRIPRRPHFEFPSILYRRDAPLFDEPNLIGRQPAVADGLRKRLRDLVSQEGCPPEQFDRLGL